MAHGFVYGLRVSSTVPIPGLLDVPATAPADVEVRLGEPIDRLIDAPGYRDIYVSPNVNEDADAPVVVVSRSDDNGCYRWIYSDGPRFIVEPSGRTVWGDWVGPGSLDEAALYLLGPILGFVLRLRGITCLHASAVSIGGRAIALVGPASAGKSTTAAALVRMGHRLISEDVVPIVEREGRIEILPGYPRIRLWPRAMRIVLGSEASLPHLTQNWDKRAFDVGDDASVFGHDPVPLAAIYAITKRSWNQRAPLVMDGATSGLSSGAALIKLVGDAYTWYALTREMRAREFALFGRVAATVPIRTLIPHKDPARLPRMCEALIEDLAALQVAPNAAAEPVAAGLSA